MINHRNSSSLRWGFIALYFILTVVSVFWSSPLALSILPLAVIVCIFIAVFLHGKKRYGLKNMLVFFIITWLVSHFFEALSIQTGFPFGYYHYDKLAGPRLFQVPLIIMFAYFSAGYASWSLANILLEQNDRKIIGKQLFLVPLIASFIMVMWDLCMDPISSTVDSLWVWKEGGAYFGVPLKNYFGWFLVVYIVFQLFAFYIARHDVTLPNSKSRFRKFFWLEPIAIYGILGLTQILDLLGVTTHLEIFKPIALITFFTMIFVTLLSFIKINR